MLRLEFRLAGMVAAVAVFGALAPTALAAPDLTSLADRVFVIVNQERTARGLPPLTRVSQLDRSAQDYAVRMAREHFFAHVAPDGATPAQRLRAAGYSWSGWGENIIAGLDTAEAVMDAWMHSPGHAANILSDAYAHLGIGVAVGGDYGIYWVQDFGAPFGPVPAPSLPRLDRLSAGGMAPGTLITLEGADFGSPGGVLFGGVPAVIDQWSTSRVVVHGPAAGGAGAVVVANAYGHSNGLPFGSPPAPPAPTPPPVPAPPATPAPPAHPTPPATSPPPANPVPTPVNAPPPSPANPVPTPPATLPPPVRPVTPPPLATRPSPTTDTTTGPAPAPAPTLGPLVVNNPVPDQGPSGSTVHLTGSGFGATPGQVTSSGAIATVLSWSATEVVLRIESSVPGRKGLRIVRSDGQQSPIRGFRLHP